MVCAAGITVNVETVVTKTLPWPVFPPAAAVILTVCVPVVTIGAVSVAVARPVESVAENGVILPPEVEKLTAVPVGGGVPAVVATRADITEVPAEAMVEGSAVTVMVLIVTGLRKSVNTAGIVFVSVTAEAVMFTVVSEVVRIVGDTLTRTVACPAALVWTTGAVVLDPLGNVTAGLSAPKVTALLNPGCPFESVTVAVMLASVSVGVSNSV